MEKGQRKKETIETASSLLVTWSLHLFLCLLFLLHLRSGPPTSPLPPLLSWSNFNSQSWPSTHQLCIYSFFHLSWLPRKFVFLYYWRVLKQILCRTQFQASDYSCSNPNPRMTLFRYRQWYPQTDHWHRQF